MYFSITTIGQFLNILVVWANRSETPSLTIRLIVLDHHPEIT